jgi:peptidoglycan hydrolase-like protein with peptidoglycan-binding domain
VSASGEFVVWVQWALSQLGYQPGKADGMVGPGTRAAICAFQNNTGMAATGEIDDRLVERLRMAVGRASMTR